MPDSIPSPCDSIVSEINELKLKKKGFQQALAKAPPSRKPLLRKRIEKVTLELASKRQQLRKCLKQNPPPLPPDLYTVKEVHQRPVTNDPAVNGKLGNNWTLKVPAKMPPRPQDGSPTQGAFDLLSKVQFAPVVEVRLTPGATREVKLQVEAPSMLMGTVRWIGTTNPLNVSLLLDGSSLASGTSHGFLKDRGASNLQVRTATGGLATLSVTNTSGTTVKVRLVLGALDLIQEVR